MTTKTQTPRRWHTQVRDIPPDVWARVRAGATSRYVEESGRIRPLNVGEYLTRCILLTERVRDIAESADSEDQFYREVLAELESLGLQAVRT